MASVGSKLITPFNSTTRGANRGKNDNGVPIVWLLLSMEPSLYDSSIVSTAQNNGFDFRGLDAQANRTTGVRAGSSFFNGFSAATTPSNLGITNRRQIAILNGVRNSPGKAFLQILVNDHPDNALTDAEAATMRGVINTVMPAPVNAPPMISDVMNVSVLRDMMTAPLPLTVSDAETVAAALALTATSSNQPLVPNANITLAGSGASRTVKLTPAPGQTGTAVITLTVSDGMLNAADTFTIAVTDPYETWAAAQGLTAANSAAPLDPDGDGSNNLLEHFYGTAPLQRTAPPVVMLEAGSPRFVFQRSKSAIFQPYVLEAGPSPQQLTPWIPAASDIAITDAGATERISIRLTGSERRFVRLRIMR